MRLERNGKKDEKEEKDKREEKEKKRESAMGVAAATPMS